MNCEEFGSQWNAHVAGILEAQDETQMLEHSRACHACGTRWREQEELSMLLTSVIQPLKPASQLSVRIVERLPAAAPPRPSQADPSGPSAEPSPAVSQAAPLLLAAVLGASAMYLVMANLGGGRGGMSQITEQMMLAEMLGRGGGMGGPAALSLAFGAGESVGLLVSLVFLFWITRASFWEALFPIRLPKSLLVARWLAIPAILVGLLRLACGVWMSTMALSTPNQFVAGDLSFLAGTGLLLNQAWTIGFWLTLLVLVYGVLDSVAARYARPLQ